MHDNLTADSEIIVKLKEYIDKAQAVLVGVGNEMNVHRVEASSDDSSMTDQNAAHIFDSYNMLESLLHGKNYFVVSTNTDDAIWSSSLDKDRIVCPCGSEGRFQCSNGCNDVLYANEPLGDIFGYDRVPADGKCPACGADLCENTVRCTNYNEQGYLNAWDKYMKFLSLTLNRDIVILELGVLMDFPNIIRWPFEKTALINMKAHFYRINSALPQMNAELKGKGISICSDVYDFLSLCRV